MFDLKKFVRGRVGSYLAIELSLPYLIDVNKPIFESMENIDRVYIGRGATDQKRQDYLKQVLNKEVKWDVNDDELIYLPTADYDISFILEESLEKEEMDKFVAEIKDRIRPVTEVISKYDNKFRGWDINAMSITYLLDFRNDVVYSHDFDKERKEGHLPDLTYNSVEIYKKEKPKNEKLREQIDNKLDDIKKHIGNPRTISEFQKELLDIYTEAKKTSIIDPDEIVDQIPNGKKYFPETI